ncbi:MAG: hypothetical protein AAB574_01680 [Patescibacteria group bacterium]
MGQILLLFIFSFFRLYQLPNSLFFFNDWGRDMLVLLKWQQTGLPPLLGPLTSALPFNQSAVYFYLLYPGYLLFGGHPISSVFTLIIFYLIVFVFLFVFLKKNSNLATSLLITFYLISVHPQFIIQNRFVWNPSFIPPLIFVSIYSFYQLQKKYSLFSLWVFSLSISLAISLSYSAAPLLISLFIYWLIFSRQKIKQYLFSLFSGFFLFNLPTLLFEIRHSFFLTNQLLNQSPANQYNNDFISRLNSIISNLFFTNNPPLNQALFFSFILIIFIVVYFHRHQRGLSFYFSCLFLITLLISLLLPLTFHYQYIFPLLCLAILVISALPKLPKILLVLLLSYHYLKPATLQNYFKPARRTYAQMNQCAKDFCQNFKEPIFVSTQASFHSFHNGPEHRYLLRKNGCNVRDIETENGQAQYMAVVIDDSSFSSRTTYYELELFGKFTDRKTIDCLPNFKIKVLKRN